MFQLNDDLSIYVTRGDVVLFTLSADRDGEPYVFKAGDLVRFKVCEKKNVESVLLSKDFPVNEDTEAVEVYLSKEETRIGSYISKPKDYWYEIELNPFTDAQTIVGYDEDGAKVFKLFPEGANIEAYDPPKPEDIPFMDDELDMTSTRPVQNQAVARAVVRLKADVKKNTETLSGLKTELSVERERINNLAKLNEGSTTGDAELADGRVDHTGRTWDNIGEHIRGVASQISSDVSALWNKLEYSLNTLNLYDNAVVRGDYEINAILGIRARDGHLLFIVPAKPNTEYKITQCCNAINNVFALNANYEIIYNFYDNGFDTWGTNVTTPSECSYIAFSHPDEFVFDPYIGLVSDYSDYSYGYTKRLNDGVLIDRNENVNHRLIATSDFMSDGDTMSLDVSDIKQNNTFSFNAKLEGDFSSIYLAHGKNEKYSGMFVVVDRTNVYFYRYHSSDILVATHAHGLTIDKFINVTVNVLQDQTADVIVSTVSGDFKVNNKWQGSKGTISCGLNGCDLKECILSFYSPDYDKKLWAFGDSYFYDYEDNRWTKIVINNGFVGAMFDGYGGRTANGGLTSLKKCLKFGMPKQILWCLGMNNRDNSDSVNTEWNNVFEELKTLCKEKNIELILCTIPTTSTANHEYKNAIIKSSGYRYVDIANALGADGEGAWYDGLLASDDTHPTSRGSKVIASRMMADVPELLG